MGKHVKEPMVETREPAKQKKARKWPWVLAGVLVFLILIVLLIPVGLSSRPFARWVGDRISETTGGQAAIGDLSVGWLRGVRVADFSFRAQDGWAQVNVDRITSQPRLGSLLTGNVALDRTVVNQPRVAIDLRQRPAVEEEPFTIDMNDLARLNDVVVRDGSVHLTDTSGRTVQLASVNSTVNLRPAGRTSRFNVSTVVAQAQTPGRIQAVGEVTPDRQQGWTFRGTTGDLTIEVDDLDLRSVAPFLELAGVHMEAEGVVSADVTGAILDGQIENLDATIVGQDLLVTGEPFNGDQLQTSQLNARVSLTRAADVINIDQLNVQTDWASLSAAGRLPTTVRSMTELLKTGAAYDLRGKFDVNLAAVLAQMPNTVGVPEGMEITGGRATGVINTTTQAGRAMLVAEAQVAGLAGMVNGETVALSEPIQATMRLSTDQEGVSRLEGLNLTSSFAQVSAGGSFEQIQYKSQIDLAALQTELGPFVNLGEYALAGQVMSTGKVSIEEGFVGTSGSLSARQIVLTAPDGNSVSEPAADVSFAVGLDRQAQVLTVNTLTVNTGFGAINVARATIPMGEDTTAPLDLAVAARDVDLGALKPYAVLFAGFPEELDLDGVAQSQLTVTRENGVYHIFTDATRIQNFTLVSPEQETFRQEQVTALFDVYIDPNARTINVEQLQVESPQIRIRKGTLRRTSREDTARVQGQLDAEWDWAAVGQIASAFVPGTLNVAGQGQVAINFASTYPVDDPNGLLGNLNSEVSMGFDRAQYMGLDFGPTDLDIRVEDGLMQIGPVSTTVNQGQLNFAGRADLGQRPAFLSTPAPVSLVQNVQITTETTDRLLRYINPIFANVVDITGLVNFELQELAIPLLGDDQSARLTGTIGIQKLRMGASPILNQILSVIGRSVRGQQLTVRPTQITLRDGILRYDDMQIDVGDNPVNFRGAIGLDGTLNLTVVLPYTTAGRTVRIGEEERAGQRIALPLTGTIDSPQLDLQRIIEQQLQDRLLRGLERLLQ
jgi:hypothetical protein